MTAMADFLPPHLVCDERDLRRAPHRRRYRARSLSAPAVSVVCGLADLMRRRDVETDRHQRRVAWGAVCVGERLGLDMEATDQLYVAGLLHDVGKIVVPTSVLDKRGPLTGGETAMVRRHAAVGGRIVGVVPELAEAALAIRHHHERWDGDPDADHSGYPDGLAGEEIPFAARVLAVVDSFDAMRRDRPYRSALSVPEALAELERCAGRQYDPSVVRAFLDTWQEAPKPSPLVQMRRAAMRRRPPRLRKALDLTAKSPIQLAA